MSGFTILTGVGAITQVELGENSSLSVFIRIFHAPYGTSCEVWSDSQRYGYIGRLRIPTCVTSYSAMGSLAQQSFYAFEGDTYFVVIESMANAPGGGSFNVTASPEPFCEGAYAENIVNIDFGHIMAA